MLYDWQRGRIPYFTAPPEDDAAEDAADAADAAAAPGPTVGHVPTEQAISEAVPCVHVFDEEEGERMEERRKGMN